ncbi:HesA/MoeB/ThiF family protein [Psychrobacter sp. I-STPA6b]|uniref:HesA/MoeB/ThiF family protein n=1 Tax=Psychrobacter sp. I-STPA6b TaxID=2585718 RepID=UPI001D0CCE59|nr:HesA/MoeB/ThiF family protein [Psychrobacter sp. I-STPA6b]
MNESTLNDAELLRYSRQILLDGWDIEAQLALKNSRILIVGAGGLGCPVSETLARAGVGWIHLLDHDQIEESNLQRQSLFVSTDVGKYKAQVASRQLRAINELITVTHVVARLEEHNAQNILSLPTGDFPDLILDCSDNFATRDLLNRLSVRFGIPLLSASAIAMTGQLALFEPQRQTGCYHCVFGEVVDEMEKAESDAQNSQNTQNCANSGVLASTTAVIGNLQANVALQYLGCKINPLASQLLVWNGKTMRQRLLGYQKDSACPVCC